MDQPGKPGIELGINIESWQYIGFLAQVVKEIAIRIRYWTEGEGGQKAGDDMGFQCQ